MTTDPQARLWQDLFADQSVESLRAKTLSAGISATRARRTRRIATAAATTMAAAATVALLIALPHSRPPITHLAPSPTAPGSLQIIDDAQLLTLLRGQDAALVGTGRAKTLVFLDR